MTDGSQLEFELIAHYDSLVARQGKLGVAGINA
jgi:hypothetical protein